MNTLRLQGLGVGYNDARTALNHAKSRPIVSNPVSNGLHSVKQGWNSRRFTPFA